MTHYPQDYQNNRHRRGTPEHLWKKWFQKLWASYPKYCDSPRGEPPAFMRTEFIRDVKYAIEYHNVFEGEEDDRREE